MNWKSVKDGLPTEPGSYLIFVPTLNDAMPYIQVAWFEPWWSTNMQGWQLMPVALKNSVTHWCELTYPKKED